MEEKDKILEHLRSIEEDSKWVSQRFDELKEKYEGKVFAVKNKRVICDAGNVQDLMKELDEKGEDVAFLLIESIPPKDVSFIL